MPFQSISLFSSINAWVCILSVDVVQNQPPENFKCELQVKLSDKPSATGPGHLPQITKKSSMKYKIKEEKIVYDGHYQFKEAVIEHDTFNGGTNRLTRECFDRGDSAAIVLFEKDTDSLLFTRQFRYPTVGDGSGWIVELVAGSIDVADETPESCIRREIHEEIGYAVAETTKISEFFTSPGGSTERLHLYFAETESTDQTGPGGGLSAEMEDIELLRIKKDRVKSMLHKGEFRDAKTIIGLQWFFMQPKG
jgi:ADP-ribose pyrophosphatase